MSKSFDQIQKSSLSYFKQQKPWIYSTIFLSIFTIIIQILNSFFVVELGNPPPNEDNIPFPNHHQFDQPPPMIDQATPAIIIIVFAILMLVIGLFSIKLHRTVHEYELKASGIKTTQDLSESKKGPETHVTLTSIFYLIIDNMELIRKLSICLYLILIFSLQWYYRYILQLFGFFPGFPHTFEQSVHFLNFYNQILLIIYVIFDIRRFLHWNAKLNKIKEFEQKTAREFEDELNATITKNSKIIE